MADATMETRVMGYPGQDRIEVRTSIRTAALMQVFNSRLAYDTMLHQVLERVVDACVARILDSASVQARISAIQAELPTRIEAAVAAAIVARVLAPATEEDDDGRKLEP